MVEFGDGQADCLRMRRVEEERLTRRVQVCGGLTVGDDQHHRRRMREPTQVPLCE